MKNYTWSMNPQKLSRAIGIAGGSASEEEVKKAYISIGGKLSPGSEPVIVEEDTTVVIETPETDTFNKTSEETVSDSEVGEVTASEPILEIGTVTASTDDTSI